MKLKHPYKYILKNLFHEQASEIVPLLLPEYEIFQEFEVELPGLKILDTVEVEDIESPEDRIKKDIGQGILGLVMPGAEAKVTGIIHHEWIENSGRFERGYRARWIGSDRPMYMVFEVQLEREAEMLPRELLLTLLRVTSHARKDLMPDEDDDEDYEDEDDGDEDYEDEDDEDEGEENEEERIRKPKGKPLNEGFDIFPGIICPFPDAVPPNIHDKFMGKTTMMFSFDAINLWEKDAREFLNTHVSAIYYLLPAMKNADAALLGLAINELAQRFQGNDAELGRHLTGMSLMLQQSATMTEEEKLAAQSHLQRFAHLIKDNPYEE